ncbi:hypothetical protein CKM354_000472900 [Cercospora kikuchii]|uniref:Protein kinase domain-containing protein n=1 Tax=Cercospora kikuchii TaxID=84275 RepID=A0A9P3CKH7_9PEZI|nr:uncharacterized protein CKM354_000472900 [Cercospora kikuchii]GIZ41425.1 hypothetical protein CKM354_000472900 [Cercospora kikuchii]
MDSDFTLPRRRRSTTSQDTITTSIHQCFAEELSEAPKDPELLRLLISLSAAKIPIVDQEKLEHKSDASSLGEGSFGTLTLAKWRDSSSGMQFVAVKHFKSLQAMATAGSEAAAERAAALHDFLFEVEIMCKCHHPNIVQLLAVSFDELSDNLLRPLLILECADPSTPDLAMFLQRLEPAIPSFLDCVSIIAGMALGLSALHSMGVVHADLHPKNVLMFRTDQSWTPKLCDFGLSGINSSQDAPRGGSIFWKAPECLRIAPDELKVHKTHPCTDVYALGLIIARILAGDETALPSIASDINRVKLDSADLMAARAYSLIHVTASSGSLGLFAQSVFHRTLRLQPKDRVDMVTFVQELLPLLANNPRDVRSLLAPHHAEYYLTPFGASHIGTGNDFHTILVSIDLVRYFRDQVVLPRNLRLALATQLEDRARSRGFTNLPAYGQNATLHFLSSNQMASLIVEQPEIRSILVEWERDPVSAIGHATFLDAQSLKQPDVFMEEVSGAHVAALEASVAANGVSAGPAATAGDIEGLSPTLSGIVPGLPAGWTPLHSAMMTGNVNAAVQLLEQGAEINAQLQRSADQLFTWTPLMVAVIANQLDAVKFLLEQSGIDVRLRDAGYFGFNVLFYAAQFADDPRILLALLSKDWRLAISRDTRGRTPLHRAAISSDKGRIGHIECLLAVGADINSIDAAGATPLHRAYAAAGGFQGLRQTIPTGLQEGVRQIISQDARANMFRGMQSQTQPLLPADLLGQEFREVWEAVVAATPQGHDAFWQAWGGFNAAMDAVYNDLAAVIAAEERRRQTSVDNIYPYLLFDARNKRIEVNVRKWLESLSMQQVLSSSIRADGQRGATHVPPGVARDTLYLLLDHGADPCVVNTTDYTPECFAYRPQDLARSEQRRFAHYSGCAPRNAFTVDQCHSILRDDTSLGDLAVLYSKAVRGDISVWYWIEHFIPMPHDMGLMFSLQRQKCDGEALAQQEIVVEARMSPPNDAHNEERLLLRQSFKLLEICPTPDTPHMVFAGWAPVKHKCTLLINIRSVCADGIMPPMCFFHMTFTSRALFPSGSNMCPGFSLPDNTTAYVHNLRPRAFQAANAATGLPSDTVDWWLPLNRDEIRLRDAEKRAQILLMKGIIKLSSPNPALYTRPILSIDETGKEKYGEREWHYDERLFPGQSYKVLRRKASTADGIHGSVSMGLWHRLDNRLRRMLR